MTEKTLSDAHAVWGRTAKRWRRSPGSVARRRVLAELRRQGVQIPRWRDSFERSPHGHNGTRRVATSIRFCVDGQWRLGLCRMGRKKLLPMSKTSSDLRRLWSWDLCRHSPGNGSPHTPPKGNAWTLDSRRLGWRERARHPDFWFLCLPSGGVLVVPDAVLPFNWTHLSVPGATGWQWGYLDRWDCLNTYPDLPPDLVVWG